jgi:ribokinase/non-canonical purine NTP pyrophosphatase (RdgB/HAM1 family)
MTQKIGRYLVPFLLRTVQSLTVAMPKVVVVGSANQDLVSTTRKVPVLGETVLGQHFATGSGGKGANQARAAAVLTPTMLICRTGDDVFGQALRRNLVDAGVTMQEDAVAVLAPGSSNNNIGTGVALILVESTTGDNMIVVTPGANHALTAADVERALEEIMPVSTPPAIVLVQLEILPATALAALKAAQKRGALTILNPAPAPDDGWSSLGPFLEFTDILIPNETELRTLCGKAADSTDESEEDLARMLLAKGVRQAVIVTLGARGALIVPKDGNGAAILVSAPAEARSDQPVVDTIGAGDAFCGSLAAYLSSGKTLSEAATLACGFAGLSVRLAGATYPTYDDLPSILRIEKDDTLSTAGINVKKTKKVLTFLTGNAKKLEEVKQILGDDLPFTLQSQNVDLPELQGTPEEIAKEKCRLASLQVHGPCLVEDTSLCFNALNGMPGPYIKHFLAACGHDGLNKILAGFDDKSAVAQTVVAIHMDDGSAVRVFCGETKGTIVNARGPTDFGWDPIFQPDEGQGKTYAEMDKSAKNAISHRGRAFAKVQAFLLGTQ